MRLWLGLAWLASEPACSLRGASRTLCRLAGLGYTTCQLACSLAPPPPSPPWEWPARLAEAGFSQESRPGGRAGISPRFNCESETTETSIITISRAKDLQARILTGELQWLAEEYLQPRPKELAVR